MACSSDWGPLDVLALRYLYGGKASGLGDTRYMIGNPQAAAQSPCWTMGAWTPSTLQANRSAPRYSSSPVDFPALGSHRPVLRVENLGIAASSWIENAIGSAYDDVLIGNDLDNQANRQLGQRLDRRGQRHRHRLVLRPAGGLLAELQLREDLRRGARWSFRIRHALCIHGNVGLRGSDGSEQFIDDRGHRGRWPEIDCRQPPDRRQ